MKHGVKMKHTDTEQNSNEVLNFLIDKNPGITYCSSIAPDWKVYFISDAVGKITGYAPEYFINNSMKMFETIVHKDDYARANRVIKEKALAGEEWEVEYRLMHKDGSVRWLLESGQTFLNRNNETNIAAYIVDISERKKREIREEYLARVSKTMIYESDLHTMLNNVMEVVLEIFQCDRAWLLNPLDPYCEFYDVVVMKTTPEYFLPEGLRIPMDHDTSKLMSEIGNSGIPLPFYSSKDPSIPKKLCETYSIKSQLVTAIHPRINSDWMFGIHCCSEEKIWDDEDIEFFHEIANRITESLNSLLFSQELEKSQSYISNVIDSMPSMLIAVDTGRNIVHWNQEAEKRIGKTADQVIGKPIENAIPRLASELESIDSAMGSNGEPLEIQKEFIFDGKLFYEDIIIYPLQGESINGVVIRIDDTTKERGLQEQLNQSRKMEAIGQLAGGIAHDFNNMLAGIIGSTEMLMAIDDSRDDDEQQLVNIIHLAASKASNLTSKLLAFSRKGNHVASAVDVHSSIDETVEILKRTLDKRVTITVNKSARFPVVLGDNSALQNSLLNLAINASHAISKEGEIKIETRNVELDESYCNSCSFNITPGEFIEVQVRDDGCGIAAENLQKIFEPFFTTKKQGKGTGLGLAAVFGTIQDHYGAIQVYSERGVGTLFSLYIPVNQVESVTTPNRQNEIIKGTGTVLLVDDEEILRIAGRAMLNKMGYDVLLAENGCEALKIFSSNHNKIDVVLSDMIMPQMNGTELFYELKQIDASCNVIISSGFTKNESLTTLKKMGLSGFIQKPYTISELSKSLYDVLN